MTQDNFGRTSSEASTGMGDTSTKFDMEPDIDIEEEEDINPPTPLPHIEMNDEWMAHIDAEWEVRQLDLVANFVPTYKAVDTFWLMLGLCPSLLAANPPSSPQGVNPPIDDTIIQHHPIGHTDEVVSPSWIPFSWSIYMIHTKLCLQLCTIIHLHLHVSFLLL